MRRTRLKRKSKSPKKKLEDKLWVLCKNIIRIKYPNVCYTCDQVNLQGANWHTGHMWAKASLSSHLKYDLRVLRPQCWRCNMLLGGMGAVFFERMQKEIGVKAMNNLIKEKQITIKADEMWFNAKIAEYEQIYEQLQKET